MSDFSETDVLGELKAVRHRGIRRIDESNRLLLPALEWFVARSPWVSVAPRGEAVFTMLESALVYVADVELRERLRRLFGLAEEFRLYSTVKLGEIAVRGLPRLERKASETSSAWESRERTWRNGVLKMFVDALYSADVSGWALPALSFSEVPLYDLDSVPTTFVGRTSELQALGHTDNNLVLVSGPPGVGKSSLVSYAASRMVPDYPDGVISIDFRGYSSDPSLSFEDGVHEMLVRLNLPRNDLPKDARWLLSIYRSITQSKRILIVADNVADSSLAMKLVPGRSSRVLLSSRQDMPSLSVSNSVLRVPLREFDPDDSLVLLESKIGIIRLNQEREAAIKIAELCRHLPLALALVGASLASRPRRGLAATFGELRRTERAIVNQRMPDSQLSLYVVVSWSVNLLSDQQRQMLMALAFLPGELMDSEIVEWMGYGTADLSVVINENLVNEQAEARLAFHDFVADFLFEAVERGDLLFDQEQYLAGYDKAIAGTRDRLILATQFHLERRFAKRLADITSGPTKLLEENRNGYSEIDRWVNAGDMILSVASRFAMTGSYDNALVALKYVFQWAFAADSYEFALKTLTAASRILAEWEADGDLDEWEDIWRQNAVLLGSAAGMFYARSAWSSRMEPLMVALEAIQAEFGIEPDFSTRFTREARYFFDGEDTAALVKELIGMREIMPLIQLEAPADSIEAMCAGLHRTWAMLEVRAGHALLRDRTEEAIACLELLYDGSKRFTPIVPTLELLWDFEPALIRLAGLLEATNPVRSLEILLWVDRTWASRIIKDAHRAELAPWISRLKQRQR